MARQIVVDIIGDSKKFTGALDSATDSSEGWGSKFGGLATKFVAGGALISGAAILAGTKIFDLGKNYEAMDAKAQTVFGDSLNTVEKWAEENARNMGLTQRATVGLAASMGDLLVPMGFTRDQAAGMSTDIVGLSGALSEWSGGTRTAEEVSEILTKALLGERDGLKALGISISEADVSARLAAKGQSELTGAALEQAKAMATQELIMEKSTDAQNAYAEGTANGIRAGNQINATFGEIAEKLTTALYPAISTIVTWFAENLPAAIAWAEGAIAEVQPVFETLGLVIGEVFGRISEVINQVVSLFQGGSAAIGEQSDELGSIINQLGEVWNSVFGAIGAFVEYFVGRVTWLWDTFGKDIMNAAEGFLGFIMEQFQYVLDLIQGIFDLFAAVFRGDWGAAWKAVQDMFNAVWNGILNAIKNILKMIVDVISKVWGGIVDFLKGVVKGVVDFIINYFKNLIGFFTGLPGAISKAVSGLFDGIPKAFKAALNWLIKMWNDLSFTIGPFDLGPMGKIGPWTLSTPNLPMFHQGGIVPGPSGSDVLAILQAGERVIPRRNAGNGATEVHIHIDQGAYIDGPSIDRLANMITQRLRYAPGT